MLSTTTLDKPQYSNNLTQINDKDISLTKQKKKFRNIKKKKSYSLEHQKVQNTADKININSLFLTFPEIGQNILSNVVYSSKNPLELCPKKQLLPYILTSKQMYAQTICLINRWLEVHCHSLKIFGLKTAKEAIDYVLRHKLVNINLEDFNDFNQRDLQKLVKNSPRLDVLYFNGSKIKAVPSKIDTLKKLTISRASNNLVLSIWSNCSNLEILDISSQRITDAAFAVKSKCKLKEFYLEDSRITDIGVAAIADNFPELESLMLLNDSYITGSTMSAFKQSKIKGFYLDGSQIGNQELAELGKGCPFLEFVDLTDTKVTDVACLSMHNIKDCGLSNTQFSDAGMASISEWKFLESIDLSSTLITDIGMKYLNPNILRVIYLEKTKITDSSIINVLSRCQNLEVIALSNNENITDKGISALKNSKIRKAFFDGTKIGDEGLVNFSKSNLYLELIDLSSTLVSHDSIKDLVKNCIYLKSISLDKVVLITNDTIRCIAKHCLYPEKISCIFSGITNLALKYLSIHHKTLNDINISGNDINDEGMEFLAKCTELEVINLGWTDVTDTGILKLTKGCSKLRRIDGLNSCEITDIGLKAIGENCRDLSYINLMEIDATVKGLIAFLKLSRKLQELILAGWNITDEDLLVIGKTLTHLEHLDLSDTQVTKKGVVAFLKIYPKLKALTLLDTISQEDLEALRKSYPAIQIVA